VKLNSSKILQKPKFKTSLRLSSTLCSEPLKIKMKMTYFPYTMSRVNIPIPKERDRRIARKDRTKARQNLAGQTLYPIALCPAPREYGGMI
jgi:hypothetical protein